MKLNIGTLVLGVVAVVVVLYQHPWVQAWTPWQIVGLAIGVPAGALFVLARIQLGRAFSVQAKASTLVTAGIYGRVRNPIYVFGGLMMVGVIIFAHRPWWFLIFTLLIPLQVIRVRKEEEVLAAKFGDAYRDYKRQTWF